jgi:hypothetical protein
VIVGVDAGSLLHRIDDKGVVKLGPLPAYVDISAAPEGRLAIITADGALEVYGGAAFAKVKDRKDEVRFSSVCTDGAALLVGVGAGAILALDPQTLADEAFYDVDPGVVAIAADRARAYFALVDGRLRCVDRKTKELESFYSLPEPPEALWLDAAGDLCAAAKGKIYVYAAADAGKAPETFGGPAPVAACVQADSVYYLDDKGAVWRIKRGARFSVGHVNDARAIACAGGIFAAAGANHVRVFEAPETPLLDMGHAHRGTFTALVAI